MHTDDPVQAFFLFDYDLKEVEVGKKKGERENDDFGLTGLNKVKMFPMDRNKVLVRFENIYDLFDC